MAHETNTPADQKAAEADVECFRGQLGPFVVAAEKTRMAMVFTNARKADNPIVFANDAFLELTGFDREEVLGASFKSLMARGAGSQALAEIETAFAGRADREPEICYRRKDDTSFWASLYISPVCDEAGEIIQHFISFVDQTDQRERQAQSDMLIDELNHRVKNTLSTVQSITRQALRASDDPTVIREAIESRIFALSRSHDLLTRHKWEGAGLHDLIDAALKPFGVADGRVEHFEVAGANIRLSPKTTLALGIAFHELATNAVKYGAFSNDVGTIGIAWDTEMRPDGEQLILTWREKDGPEVVPPTHKGFGSQVIERGLAHELHGKVCLEYLPEGLVCTIDLPVPRKVVDA
ncbi:HWE histidine kinase domain-containing protein [Sphingomonas sp. AR_OL41]|uniref:HWE histidine kinase domain-containing protein n=1 Tax=Sphingomonas sp. AR_OL41 TaxID=3042729 RepID=UPI0024818AFA|nr:HWE histidine kinase domain-containing protein [Sphingomonas sp. AR_OL41]MDH7972185.1 HWE histidine kinase domain-containing protein [Sphingomonas sp. AR_OL41]